MPAKIVVSAPGKIIFSGDHAVVFGKGAIAASIGLKTTCKIETVEDEDDVIICMSEMKMKKTFLRSELVEIAESLKYNPTLPSSLSEENLEKLKSLVSSDGEMSGPQDLACLIFLMIYFSIVHVFVHKRSLGLRITLTSALPVSSGLGSSASLAVSLSAACLLLAEVFETRLNTNLNNHFGHVFLPEELELINKWAYEAETLVHGRPSGIDNSISTFGHAIFFKEGVCQPLKHFPVMEVLLVNSNVKRSTAQLIDVVHTLHKKLSSIVSRIFDTMECITEELRETLAKIYSATKENMPKDSVNELYKNIEELLQVHQHLLNSIGVGHPSLNQISEICAGFRLVTKLTGAGGGGCAFAVLPPEYPGADFANLITALEDEGYETWKTTVGCQGVAIETFQS